MKKTLTLSILLLAAQTAKAQEADAVKVTSFWQDKTFLMLAGGALFLIILLIVKKVVEKRSAKKYQGSENL
jgi:hypothetical protein